MHTTPSGSIATALRLLLKWVVRYKSRGNLAAFVQGHQGRMSCTIRETSSQEQSPQAKHYIPTEKSVQFAGPWKNQRIGKTATTVRCTFSAILAATETTPYKKIAACKKNCFQSLQHLTRGGKGRARLQVFVLSTKDKNQSPRKITGTF